MTVRLTVRRASWRSRVARLAGEVDGLVPVVKGNGYGLGRAFLAGVAAEFADTVAVGTVHELDVLDAHPSLDVVVLTPALAPPPTNRPILTVGRPEHVDALAEWGGRVVVKLT
ncbi:MAG: alanine racemase [Actinomycetota bacterium]